MVSRDFMNYLNIGTDEKSDNISWSQRMGVCIRISMRLQKDSESIVYSNGPVFRSADDDLYQHVYKNIKVIDTTGICQVHTNKTMSVALFTSDLAGRQITCCSKWDCA